MTHFPVLEVMCLSKGSTLQQWTIQHDSRQDRLLRVPGKILLSRRGESSSHRVTGPSASIDSKDLDDERTSSPDSSSTASVSTSKMDSSRINGNEGNDGLVDNVKVLSGPFSSSKGSSTDSSRPSIGGRATDSARVARFKKELAAPAVNLDALQELAWSGVPPKMRPIV